MFERVQVRVDPAGHCDPEGSREVVQRADRAADQRVQEQVKTRSRLTPHFLSAAPSHLLGFILPQLVEGHGAPDRQEHAHLPARHQGQNFLAEDFCANLLQYCGLLSGGPQTDQK